MSGGQLAHCVFGFGFRAFPRAKPEQSPAVRPRPLTTPRLWIEGGAVVEDRCVVVVVVMVLFVPACSSFPHAADQASNYPRSCLLGFSAELEL